LVIYFGVLVYVCIVCLMHSCAMQDLQEADFKRLLGLLTASGIDQKQIKKIVSAIQSDSPTSLAVMLPGHELNPMSLAAPPVPPGWSETASAVSSSSGSVQLTSVKHEPHLMRNAADVVSINDRVLHLHALIAKSDMTPAAHTAANDAAATTAALTAAAENLTATSAAASMDDATASHAAAAEKVSSDVASMDEALLTSANAAADATAKNAAAEKAASDAAAMEETRLKSAKDEADASAKKAAKKAADDEEAATVAHKAAADNEIAAALVTPAPAATFSDGSWADWIHDPTSALHAAPAFGADPTAHAIIDAADMVHAAPASDADAAAKKAADDEAATVAHKATAEKIASDAAAMEETWQESVRDEADAAAKNAADDEAATVAHKAAAENAASDAAAMEEARLKSAKDEADAAAKKAADDEAATVAHKAIADKAASDAAEMEEARLKSAKDEADTAAKKAADDEAAAVAHKATAEKIASDAAAMEEARLKSEKDEADAAAKKAADDEAATVAHKATAEKLASDAAAMCEARLKSARDEAEAAADKASAHAVAMEELRLKSAPGTGTFDGLPSEGEGKGSMPEDKNNGKQDGAVAGITPTVPLGQMLLMDVTVLMNAVTAAKKAAQLSMDSLPFSLSDTQGVVAISASAAEAAESVLKSSPSNGVDMQAVKRLLSDVVSSTGTSYMKRQRVYVEASAAAATSDSTSISDPAVAKLSPDEQCKLRTSRAAAAASAVAFASDLEEPIRKRLLDAVHDQQCKRLKIVVVDRAPTSAGSAVHPSMGPPAKKVYVPNKQTTINCQTNKHVLNNNQPITTKPTT
jgi:hypothetical protein